MKYLPLCAVIGLMIIFPLQAYALGPGNPECYENGTCDLFKDPLTEMVKPWTAVFGPWFYIIFWGLIVGIIWLKTHHTMLTGVIGLAIAGLYTFQGLNAINTQILYVGGSLIVVAIAVIMYQLIVNRLIYPTN
jgi:hypothetical protein